MFANLIQRQQDRLQYFQLREQHPTTPAKTLWAYLTQSDGSQSLKEFSCPGHEWAYTGSAYGGDDESYSGEGRCYCVHCGADGDA